MAKDFTIFNQFNILYLEDDISLLKNTKDILDDYFQNVFAVSTIKEAFYILKQRKVDVLISDILLRNESGLDFVQQIQSSDEFNIPIILTTAHANQEYLLDAIKLKVDNYIIKPIDFNVLRESLYNILYPITQNKKLMINNSIIKIISIVFDNNQIDVIKYIMSNLNQNNEFIASYADIMQDIKISKPTLIKLFKILLENKIFIKKAHKTYQFQYNTLKSLDIH